MEKNKFLNTYCKNLTDDQRRAVQCVNGPVLLLAVPGSGKTTVLVHRLGYMTHALSIDPRNILTITYTVSAAADMKERYRSYFDDATSDHLEFRTINGICAKIISLYGRRIEKTPFQLLSSEKERLRLLSEVYFSVTGNYVAESDRLELSSAITYIKNGMLSSDEIKAMEQDFDWPVSKLYEAYNRTLREQKRMDFDDQMIYALSILRKTPELLQSLHDRYHYILVDEAQDTSKIQHLIIRMLAGPKDNLFMVGDEDQSIYGFRAAYPEALLHFEKDHPGAKVLLMEDNFRSSQDIVTAANHVIGHNRFRRQKTMKAHGGSGRSVQMIDIQKRAAQYSYLLKVADHPENTTAVLFRNNESALPLIDLLERGHIPYRFRGTDLTFFSHRVVRDLRAILEFSLHPSNPALFEEIYYKIGTYISKDQAKAVIQMSRTEKYQNCNLLDIFLKEGLGFSRTEKSVINIQKQLRMIRSESPFDALIRILGSMGYRDYLSRANLSDAKVRILYALASLETNVESFLRRLDDLQQIISTHENRSDCKFVLSTIHSSKGLEYDTVYLIDVEDGIFPERIGSDDSDLERSEKQALEEERRIFYVAITRAKNRLYLFRMPRNIYPSRFLNELNIFSAPSDPVQKRRTSTKTISSNERRMDTERAASMFDEQGYQSFYVKLSEGSMVEHAFYGKGTVLSIQKDRIEVQFKEGSKRMDLRILYARKLIRLSDGWPDQIDEDLTP